MKFSPNSIGMFVAGILIGFFMISSLLSAFDLPGVYISYTQDKCVKVVNHGTDYTCKNLPSRYNITWVK